MRVGGCFVVPIAIRTIDVAAVTLYSYSNSALSLARQDPQLSGCYHRGGAMGRPRSLTLSLLPGATRLSRATTR